MKGKDDDHETNLFAEVSTVDAEHATEPGDAQIVTGEIITDNKDDKVVDSEQNTADNKIIDADENMDVKVQSDAVENAGKDGVEQNQKGFKKSSEVNSGGENKSLPSNQPCVSEEVDSKPSNTGLSDVASANHVEDVLEDSASKKDNAAKNTKEN